LVGNFLSEVLVLEDFDGELTGVLDLRRCLQRIDHQSTVGFITHTIIVVAAVERDERTALFINLQVNLLFIETVASLWREKALGDNSLELELQV